MWWSCSIFRLLGFSITSVIVLLKLARASNSVSMEDKSGVISLKAVGNGSITTWLSSPVEAATLGSFSRGFYFLQVPKRRNESVDPVSYLGA